MKRAALYMRVSTLGQHPETQMHDLHEMARQRGYQIIEQYTDMISGAKARRPGLDAMMTDARRGQFDVVLVWASDRDRKSTRLNSSHLGISYAVFCLKKKKQNAKNEYNCLQTSTSLHTVSTRSTV